MSDDDGGWEVVTKDSKRKNKKQKDVVEDNDDTTTTTTTTAAATSTTTSNDSKSLVDSKETAAPAAAGGATNSDATTTTPAADAPPVELKIELSSSFQAKILLAMSTIERGETNVDRRLKNHVLHLQEDANAAAPVAYQSLLGWGSNLPARVVDLLQAMDEQVPVDDQIAALAFVRLFEFVREHYYSIEKTQRKPLNDLLPELNRQLPNYNIAKYKNQLRNFIIEKLKKMNRGRLTKRYKDHINKCENVDEVRAWIFQQKGGREIWHGAETEMTGIRELGQLLHVIKSTDWKSRAPNRKSMQDIVSSVKRLVISCPRLLDLADHCIKSNGFIVVRVAKPLTEAQFRDKSTHKPAVYDHKFTSVAELPDIGLLWPDVETYMRTQWIAPAAAATAASKATSTEDDDNTASTTDKQ